MTDLMDRLRAADPVPGPLEAPPVEWLVTRLEGAGEKAAPPAPGNGAAPARPVAPPAPANGAAPPARPVAPPAPANGAAPTRPFAPSIVAAPRRRRRRRRAGFFVPVFVAALVAAVVVLFGRGPSPDVVAEARAALGAPGEIVHTVTRTERFSATGRLLPTGHYMDKGELSDRTEQWAALDPLRSHTRMTILPPGGGPALSLDSDYANGVDRSARSWSNALHVYPMPPKEVADYEAANTGAATALDAGADPVAGIRTLLADGKLAPAGETDLDGRRVLRLRGERSGHLGNNPREVMITVHVEYAVDAKTYEPVQVTYRVTPSGVMGGAATIRKTFETFDRLQLAGNEALLRIPDAKQRHVITHR